MKYKKENVVNAIYSNANDTDNLYIDAMPELLCKNDYKKEISSYPPFPQFLNTKSPEDRRAEISLIYNFFYPMDYMYCIYDMLYRAIICNYSSKHIIDTIKQINHIYKRNNGYESKSEFSTQSFSGAILGVPGIGKTSTIKRSLSLIPQVIIHNNYRGAYIYQKQITYLFVECPSDCSVKTLAANIIASIDQAIGSTYFEEMVTNKRLSSASALAMKVKIACLNHRVGLLVIDEIQNTILTATKNHQIKPLIKFLVELTNETCISICFTGTLEAEDLFQSQEHLMRRTRGFRLLPLKPNVTYYNFISALWNYQWTLNKSEINEKIVNIIYDYSGGIPDYIIKIFIQSQIQSILEGKEKITIENIKKVVSMLNISVSSTYNNGSSISDFEVSEIEFSKQENQNDIYDNQDNTYYKMNKRGRPTKMRDKNDLIEIYHNSKNDIDFINKLKECNLIQIIGDEIK